MHNPISELARAMQLAVDRSHAEYRDEIINQVVLAAESSQSKRKLLGLDRKHRTAAEMPMFKEKMLF